MISDKNRKRLNTALTGSGIFIATYDLAAISVALLVLERAWNLNGSEVALLGSSAIIGSIIGSAGAGIFADRYGRKNLLLWDFATYVFASVGSAISPDYFWLIVFRFIVGLGIGADFAVVFPYLAETRPASSRGRDMAAVMMAANFGMILAYGLGGVFLSHSPDGWRYVLAAGGLMAVPVLAMRSRIPESALWKKKRKSSIMEILGSLTRKSKNDLAVTSFAWLSYQVGDQGLSLFLPVILFSALGIGDSEASYGSLLVKAVTIPAAIVTVIMIDRAGRRPLQLFGFLGRALPLLIMSILLAQYGTAYVPILILLLLAAYFFGAMGPDKTVVISPAEQFSTEHRGTGQGISESFGRIGGLIGVAGYAILSAIYGPWAGILMFAAFAFLGLIASLYMKETAAGRNPDASNLHDHSIAEKSEAD